MENLYIQTIENAIRGIKLGTKKPIDVEDKANKAIERLKKSNHSMGEDLEGKLFRQVSEYNRKINEKRFA